MLHFVVESARLYYPLHNNLPKPFRFAVGERILAESAECLRAIVLANAADKASAAGLVKARSVTMPRRPGCWLRAAHSSVPLPPATSTRVPVAGNW